MTSLSQSDPQGNPDALLVTPYSAIEARQTEWLWFPYLPLGNVVTVEGNMGEGKSWLTLALAAAVSTGRFPFTSETRQPASVLHVNIEDNPGATIRPRLDILGADCARVQAIQGVSKRGQGGIRVLDF